MTSETHADHHPLPLDAEETVDAVPVVDEVRALERTRPQLPARRAAAVAATGFVAGAATVVAISHHARKRTGGRLGGRRRGKGADALPIVATRSVLLDIHLLGRE
jgi:hypothetical protein